VDSGLDWTGLEWTGLDWIGLRKLCACALLKSSERQSNVLVCVDRICHEASRSQKGIDFCCMAVDMADSSIVVIISSDSDSDMECTAGLSAARVVFTPTKRPASPASDEEDHGRYVPIV
jgi:hypothetical protein